MMRGSRRFSQAPSQLIARLSPSCRSASFSFFSYPRSGLFWLLAPSLRSSERLLSTRIHNVPQADLSSSSSAKTRLLELLKLVSPETEVQFLEKEVVGDSNKKGYRSQVFLKTTNQFTLTYTGDVTATSKKASQHVVALRVLNDLMFTCADEKSSSHPSSKSFLVQHINRQCMEEYTTPLKEWLVEMNKKAADSATQIMKDMIRSMRINTRKGSKIDPASIRALHRNLQASQNVDLGDISKCMLALNIYFYEDEGIKELIDVLTSKLSKCEEVMASFQVRDCMFGLRNMSNHVPGIAELLEVLSRKIAERELPLREETGDTLYGLRSMDSGTTEVRSLLRALKKQIKGQKRHMKAYQVENALYGLKNMSCEVPEVRDVVRHLTKQINRCEDIFKERNVAFSLYGLQNMRSHSVEVRKLVQALTLHVARNVQPLKPLAVGSCLYGLKGMNSKHQEIRSLLSVVSKQIKSCREAISSDYIAMALYGLQNMSSDTPEVEEILMFLTNHLSDCQQEMSGANIAMSLYGLRNMNSGSRAVLELLKVLTVSIKNSSERLNAQEIGNSFFGMQKMCGDSPEVRELLEVLTLKVFKQDDVSVNPVALNGQEIANSLYGLQRMDNGMVRGAYEALKVQLRECGPLKAREIAGCLYSMRYKNSVNHVRDVLVELTKKVNTCDEIFGSQEVGSSLYGLCSLDPSHQEVRDLISALIKHVKACHEPLNSQAMGNSLYALRNMSDEYEEVKDLLIALSQQFAKNKDQLEVASVGYPEGNLYETLKRISTDYSEVQDLLIFLSDGRAEETSSYTTAS